MSDEGVCRFQLNNRGPLHPHRKIKKPKQNEKTNGKTSPENVAIFCMNNVRWRLCELGIFFFGSSSAIALESPSRITLSFANFDGHGHLAADNVSYLRPLSFVLWGCRGLRIRMPDRTFFMYGTVMPLACRQCVLRKQGARWL